MIKKVNKKLVKVTSTILISAFVLTGCGAGDTVAKVNGDDITVEEYGKDYNIIKKRYETQYGPEFFEQKGPEGKTMEEVLKTNVLDKLIIEQIIMQKAQEDNIVATDEEVNKEITGFKEMVGGKEGFDKFLQTNGMTEDYFKSGIKKELTVEKYREKYLKGLKLDEKELKDYYAKNKDNYETIKASHILVENEEEAKEISKQLKEGADFAELSKKSIEPGAAERAGDLGFFGKGQMVPEFEKAAFALKVDEISDPVKTEHGYHIIKVTEKKESYDQVKEEVKTDLENEKFEQHLEKLKEEAKVKTYEDNIKDVGKKDAKEEKTPEAKPTPETKPAEETPAVEEAPKEEVKEVPVEEAPAEEAPVEQTEVPVEEQKAE